MGEGNAAEQIEYSPDQVDAMWTAIQSGGTAEAGLKSVDTASSSPEHKAQESFEKRIKWNGQEIVVNDPNKYDTWAQQGYDYSQRMSQLNAEREQFQREMAENSEKYKRYQEIDSYVSQDPEWWRFVEQQWSQRDQNALAQGLGINPTELAPEIKQVVDPLLAEVTELKKFYNDVQRQKLEQQQAAEDHALLQEISGLQKQFPEFDFQAADNNGQTLEAQVVKFANEKQIPSFTAAFYAYYQDQLQKVYELRGRKAVEDEWARRKREGIVSQSETPQLQPNSEPSRGGSAGRKSYNDLAREAREEFGIT